MNPPPKKLRWWQRRFGYQPRAHHDPDAPPPFKRPTTHDELTLIQRATWTLVFTGNGQMMTREQRAEARRLVAWGFLKIVRRGSSRRRTLFGVAR